MPFTTYAELKTGIADFDKRSSDSAYVTAVDDFIDLAEAYMQREAKLVEFESTATVTLTDGSGNLPSDFVGMRAIYANGDTSVPMTYITPERFDGLRQSGLHYFYTISGSILRTSSSVSSAVMTYLAKFTALSSGNTTNSLITNHPDAYLFGALHYAAIWRKDENDTNKFKALFELALASVKKNNAQRKFAGPLQVRPA
jgi:hypothetical protein